MITVVVPAFNEEDGIGDVLDSILEISENEQAIEEVIVVDDGSTDETPSIVSEFNVSVVSHSENRGYGASLKSGIRAASSEYILIIDGDGTYPVDALPDLLEHVEEFDMVVGARTGSNVNIKIYRRPAKKFLSILANYLTNTAIPDLNSGLRIFRKQDAMNYFHILPSGFSFTTTITLAYHTSGKFVRYVPIDYHARDGESKISPLRDGLNFVILIFRTITYFNPLRIFVPMGTLFLVLGLMVFVFTGLIQDNFMETTTTLLGVAGIQVFLYGLLADLVVRRGQT